MRARVIGLGQSAAGDDGVGLVVLERLREQGLPPGVELRQAAEASAVLPLLETDVPVVLVDAVLGAPAGEVLELALEALDSGGLMSVSTHGLGLRQVVELARLLSPGSVSPSIRLVAVTIARPRRYRQGLSPEVAAAAVRAAAGILSLLKAGTLRPPHHRSKP